MRLDRLLVIFAFYVSVTFAIALPAQKRALNEVFDPFQTIQPQQPPHQETHIEHETEHTTHPAPPTSVVSVVGLLEPSSKPKDSSTGSHSQTTLAPLSTASSTISTSTLVSAPTAHTSATPAPATAPSAAVPTHTQTPSGGQSINRGPEEWKVIGVAVISFSAVAAILLLAVFFDQWWGFIRDLVWRKKRKDDGVEELIPDWEKADWEVRMARDNDRYPSLPPPARAKSITRDYNDLEKAPAENMTGIGSGYATTNIYAPQPIRSDNYAHGLGILTPVPQARYADQPLGRSTSLKRSNSRAAPPSPAVTLVDPYGGIE